MSAADRGKKAEKDVAKYLAEMSARIAVFDWHRVYDARSAGGRFAAQPGDYAFYTPHAHGLVEAKEVEHDFRLPKKNFEKEQIAKLHKRQIAGGQICIVINFTTTKLWRLVPLSFFILHLDQPSWDLTGFPTFPKAKNALDEFFNKEI